MARQKKDGAKSFTAVIRKKLRGKIILTFGDTFPSRQAAEHWMKKTERNLKGKGALDRPFADSASCRRSADRKS